MESRMAELMEAIQESEGQAARRVLTLLGGRYISEKMEKLSGKAGKMVIFMDIQMR